MSTYLDLSTKHADVRVLERSDRFIVSWKQGKRRQRKAFVNPSAARAYAQKILDALEAGKEASLELSASEAAHRLSLVEREAKMTIEELLSEWKRLLGKVKEEKEVLKKQPDIRNLVADYLSGPVSAKSTRHYQTVESHLNAYLAFGKENPTEYLKKIKHPVTHNNHRASLSAMYNWAVERGLRHPATLPKPRKNDSRPEIGFITPDQLTTILRDAPANLAPTIALAALGGIRMAEIQRLRWKDIDFDEQVVLLGRDITKTGNGRVVTICTRLLEILFQYRPDDDLDLPVCRNLWPSAAIHERFPDLPPNALRHSYATYALALNRDAAAVAEQLGNSPRILKAHYAGLATKAQAEAFFGLTSPTTQVSSEQ